MQKGLSHRMYTEHAIVPPPQEEGGVWVPHGHVSSSRGGLGMTWVFNRTSHKLTLWQRDACPSTWVQVPADRPPGWEAPRRLGACHARCVRRPHYLLASYQLRWYIDIKF